MAQIVWSHHWIDADERLVRHCAPYRYAWPSELDLMAKITGFWSGTAGQAGTGGILRRQSLPRSRHSRNCRSCLSAQIH